MKIRVRLKYPRLLFLTAINFSSAQSDLINSPNCKTGNKSQPQIKLFATQNVPCSPTTLTILTIINIKATFLIKLSNPDNPPFLNNSLNQEKSNLNELNIGKSFL